MKICPKCRNEIGADMPYCTFCGAQQPPENRVFPHEPTPQQWPRGDAPNTVRRPETASAEPTAQQWLNEEETRMRKQLLLCGERGSGMSWIVFMRVVLWFAFALLVIAFVGRGIWMISYDLVFQGVGVILGGVLVSFIAVGGGMVALNNAGNNRKTANNTAKILQLLQNQDKK